MSSVPIFLNCTSMKILFLVILCLYLFPDVVIGYESMESKPQTTSQIGLVMSGILGQIHASRGLEEVGSSKEVSQRLSL